MRTIRSMACIIAVAVSFSACASGGGSSTGSSGNRNLVTREQIDAMTTVNDAYDIVERVRADMLRMRSGSTVTQGNNYAAVYVDGVRRGEPESLRQIPATDVGEIRFLNATEASQRYGPDHLGGVIEVKIRR